MIPTNIQQSLFISTKQTFTKPTTQPTVKHPLIITNLSQHNIIIKFRTTHAKNIQLALRQIMIGPFQSNKYQIILKGQMQKDMTIKLQVTWCKIVVNGDNGSGGGGDKGDNKMIQGQKVKDGNLGKVDVQNMGRRIVAFRRVESDKENKIESSQSLPSNNKSQQNITSSQMTKNKNINNSQQKNYQQQQQIIQLKQTIKTLQNQLQDNRTIIQQLKQINIKINQLPNVMLANLIDTGCFNDKQKIKQEIKQNVIDIEKQVEKRINVMTDIILGLMKQGGLNQLLVKMEGVMWGLRLLTSVRVLLQIIKITQNKGLQKNNNTTKSITIKTTTIRNTFNNYLIISTSYNKHFINSQHIYQKKPIK